MKGRILLVDDNEAFLDSTKDVLVDEGYHVVTAVSGEQAVELFSAQSFDVVLMDVKMPGMNGVDSFVKMKKVVPDIKVIMVTAYSVANLSQQAMEEGVFAILDKPLDIDKLFQTIEQARSNGNGGFILVVDDNKELCDSFIDILSTRHYQVLAAHDGEEAIKKAGSHNFDIILLDMKLPVLNGQEVYRHIKSIQPNIVAILISGYAEKMDFIVQQTIRENAHTFLRKPVDMGQLLAVIKDICTAKRAGTYHKPIGDQL